MVAEVVLGVIANSLALLADAGHMLTDAAALGLAALRLLGGLLPARGRLTFGFARAEILAAQANGMTLLIIGIWILYSGRAPAGRSARRAGGRSFDRLLSPVS